VAESPRSRLLFTTRNGSIASQVGADEQRLDVLAGDKARELLARWAGVPTAALLDTAGDLIRECGRLPLALSIIGALLRWKAALVLAARAGPAKSRQSGQALCACRLCA
jgi:hypothetical protein